VQIWVRGKGYPGGNYVFSLREAFKALLSGEAYRVTLEWKKWLLSFTRRRPWIRPRKMVGG